MFCMPKQAVCKDPCENLELSCVIRGIGARNFIEDRIKTRAHGRAMSDDSKRVGWTNPEGVPEIGNVCECWSVVHSADRSDITAHRERRIAR